MLISLQKINIKSKNYEQGFSLVELIIVLLIISILSVLSLMAFKSEKLFLADNQAYLLLDILKEAKQRALTQHVTMRVEINKNRNIVRLINENKAGDASDDKEIKSLSLENPNLVNIESSPTNIANSPTDSAPIPAITFKPSVHPLSNNEQVVTFRFLRNGNVVDAGSNEIGSNSAITGATIFVWSPNYSESGTALNTGIVIRAITLMGSSGTTKYWKCPIVDDQCIEWKQ